MSARKKPTILQSTQNVYEQRPCSQSENCSYDPQDNGAPSHHATSYSYADSYSDGNNGRNSYAHPTTTTNALNQRITNQYDYSSGKPTLAIDLNGTRTQYAYADPLDRLTQVVYALGSGAETQRNITYSPNLTFADQEQFRPKQG